MILIILGILLVFLIVIKNKKHLFILNLEEVGKFQLFNGTKFHIQKIYLIYNFKLDLVKKEQILHGMVNIMILDSIIMKEHF